MLIARCFASILAAGLFMLTTPMTAVSSPMVGPSFDCSKPSEIEAVICHDAELSADDRRMMSFYEAAKPGALGTGSNQLSVQRRWLKGRDKACAKDAWRSIGSNGLRACIAFKYDERLEELAIATLFVSPQKSLAELRRVNPKAAPIYEAVFDYATIDNVERRVRTVEAVLAPVYAAAAPTVDSSAFKLPTPHAAAIPGGAFANFFDVSAIFADIRLTWPCAAVNKRPDLIEGLGFLVDGAIDSQVPDSDCYATLPPVPELESLVSRAFEAQPPCGGTIRFTAGREYSKVLDAVRLHRMDVPAAETWFVDLGDTEPAQRRFRRKHALEIIRARTALTAYYVGAVKVAPSTAQTDAERAIDVLVSGAFSLCP